MHIELGAQEAPAPGQHSAWAGIAVYTPEGLRPCFLRPVPPAGSSRVSECLRLGFRRQWPSKVGRLSSQSPARGTPFFAQQHLLGPQKHLLGLLLSFSFPFHLFLNFGWFFPTENPGVRAPRLAPWCGFLDEPWLHLPSQGFMKSPSQTCSQRAGYGQRGARPRALAALRAWEGVSPSPTPNSLSLEDGARGGLQSPACAAPGRPLPLAEGHGTTIPSMHRPRALRPVRSVGELRPPACPGPPAAHTRISGLRSGRGRGPRRRGGAPGGGPCGLVARTAWPRAGRLLVCVLGGRAASRSEAQRGRSRGDASSSGRG